MNDRPNLQAALAEYVLASAGQSIEGDGGWAKFVMGLSDRDFEYLARKVRYRFELGTTVLTKSEVELCQANPIYGVKAIRSRTNILLQTAVTLARRARGEA